MNWDAVTAGAYWLGAIVSSIALIGGFCWWFAKLYAKICGIETGVASLKGWVGALADGKGAVCSRHEERLDGHDRELEDHGRRIATLEQHRRGRSDE